MKNDEIRAANRKALPKFLLFTLVCAVIGGIRRTAPPQYGLDQLSGVLANASAFFGTRIAPVADGGVGSRHAGGLRSARCTGPRKALLASMGRRR